MWPRSTRTFEHNSNNHNNSNNVNNYKKHNSLNNHNNQNNTCLQCDTLRRRGSGSTGRPAERATPPGPTWFRYGRPPSRASDTARADALQGPRVLRLRRGGAPAVIVGGRGSGERSGLLAAEQRDGRGEVESIPSLPGTEPIGISPPPCLPSTKRQPPPHAARGPYLSSSHWRLVRVARGPARLVVLMPLFLRDGAWGKPRSGQAWQLGA
jgi:hypothetical protein